MMSSMRVEGKLELHDLQRMMVDATKSNVKRDGPGSLNLSGRPVLILVVALGLDIALMFLYQYLHQNDANVFMQMLTLLLLGMVGILTLVMVAAWWFARAAPRALAKQPGVLGKRVYTIDQDGLRVATEVSEGITKWRAISHVRSDSNYLFLYLGKILGPVIPRRFFASADEFSEFVSEIERRVNAADI